MTPLLVLAVVLVGGGLFMWMTAVPDDQYLQQELMVLEQRIAHAMMVPDFAEALRLATLAGDRAESVLGPCGIVVRLRLRQAFLLAVDGRRADADALREKTLAMAKALPASDKPVLAKALMDMAGTHRANKQLEASGEHWKQALAVWDELGVRSDDVLRCCEQLVQITEDLGQLDEADVYSRRRWELALELPKSALYQADNHAWYLLRRGHVDEALRVAEQNAQAFDGLDQTNLFRQIATAQGRHDDAIDIARKRFNAAEGSDRAHFALGLAAALRGAGRFDEALTVARDAEAIKVAADSPDKHMVVVWTAVAEALAGLERRDEALAMMDRVIATHEAELAVEHSDYQQDGLEAAREVRARLAG